MTSVSSPHPASPAGPLWRILFLPFAAGYFVSYFFRTANAVIGLPLAEELQLSAGDLGLLTSTYFLTFAFAQIPLGMLLDRYGSRRVEAGLLLLAALGALVFASGHGIAQLAAGRALIGLGVSACLMASYKAFASWYPPEQQASMSGWIMAAGGLGAVAATAPLEMALHLTGWRQLFIGLAVATVLVALWIFRQVPDAPGGHAPEPLRVQWQGVCEVFASRHFWRYAPIGLVQIGGLQAIHGLWAASWLKNVNGFDRATAADHLATMSIAMLFAYVGIGMLATRLLRRGVSPTLLLGGGIGVSMTVLLLIALDVLPHQPLFTHLLWGAYGTFITFGTLAYSQCAQGFPLRLAGRANTAFNLLVFIGAFCLQWGVGALFDLLARLDISVFAAHRAVFVAIVLAQYAALAWFLWGGRKAGQTPA